MRRETDQTRPVVADETLLTQRGDGRRWVGMLERDDRRTPRRVDRAAHGPALRERAVDETLRELHVPAPDARDPDLA